MKEHGCHDHGKNSPGEQSGHGHDGDHDSGGDHHHGPPEGFDAAFAIGSALNAIFIIAETIFGLGVHSVALLADAAHNLGDVLGLLLAWWAAWLGRRRPTASRTYGFGRSSILASLMNGVVLLVGVGGIAVEAIRRLIDGVAVVAAGGKTVMIVAAVGIAVNGAFIVHLLPKPR